MIDLSEFFSGEALARACERKAAGEPEAYIIGRAWFYREEYEVSPAVLIPRPDTERVVETLVRLLPQCGTFADLCCGCGCIGISALCERRDCTAFCCDISAEAVAISRRNARANGVSDRYTAVCADVGVFSVEGADIVVSNPPYIRHDIIAKLDKSVRDYEPHLALDGGEDGLSFYRMILDRYTPRDCFIFEIGYDQREGICALAWDRGMSCEITKDYGGNDRVAVIRRKL